MDIPANSRHGLILVRDLERLGIDDRQLRRRVVDGSMVRVSHGSYMGADEWAALDSRGCHLARAEAFNAASLTRHVFSHFTAAAVHGIPVLGPMPHRVHVTVERFSTSRFRDHVSGHYADLEPGEVETVGDLLVTSRARTIVDLALSTTFPAAVTAVDWFLADGGDRSTLHTMLDAMPGRTGRKRAYEAVEFGDRRSGSPGESLSRANMHLLRLPEPDLQVPMHDTRGLIGIVDFWWERCNLVGEFDGRGKYLMTGGIETSEIVLRERDREKRLISSGREVTRWDWGIANDLRALADHLAQSGLYPD